MEENRNFGPTRGSIISVINEVWKILVVVLGAILGYLFLGNKEIMQQKYFIIILLIIKPFVKLAIYFSTTYEVKNKSFLVKSGIFTRKILEIPLEVITTVDFGQSLFYQIFQCYKVKIDNASQNVAKKDESEILVSLAKKDALYLKELLTGKSLEH